MNIAVFAERRSSLDHRCWTNRSAARRHSTKDQWAYCVGTGVLITALRWSQTPGCTSIHLIPGAIFRLWHRAQCDGTRLAPILLLMKV